MISSFLFNRVGFTLMSQIFLTRSPSPCSIALFAPEKMLLPSTTVPVLTYEKMQTVKNAMYTSSYF